MLVVSLALRLWEKEQSAQKRALEEMFQSGLSPNQTLI